MAPQEAKPREAKPKKDALAAFQTPKSKGAQKMAAFATLPDGPLNAKTIRALFSGLDVTPGYGWHNYRADGSIDGRHIVNVGNIIEDDYGSWTVDSVSRLCTLWNSGHGDGKTCYKASKRGGKIQLNYRSRTVIYEILE